MNVSSVGRRWLGKRWEVMAFWANTRGVEFCFCGLSCEELMYSGDTEGIVYVERCIIGYYAIIILQTLVLELSFLLCRSLRSLLQLYL